MSIKINLRLFSLQVRPPVTNPYPRREPIDAKGNPAIDQHTMPLGTSARCYCPYILNVGFALAFGAFLMLMFAGVGFRLGVWNFRTGFSILKYAAYGGVAATVVILFSVIFAIKRGKHVCLVAVFMAGAMVITSIAVPSYWKGTAKRLPRIHDISTDLDNPPLFVAILPLRQPTDNPVEYGGAEVAAKQQQAYPDVKSMIMKVPADLAFTQALAAVHRMRWEIVAEVPEQGRIEAIDTTVWFGFKDDIVIRVTPEGDGARVDIRSVSRVGISDAGTNARRISAYLRMLASLSS